MEVLQALQIADRAQGMINTISLVADEKNNAILISDNEEERHSKVHK